MFNEIYLLIDLSFNGFNFTKKKLYLACLKIELDELIGFFYIYCLKILIQGFFVNL